MTATADLCRKHTDLSEDDIAAILAMAEHLPAISKLSEADVFIDCFHGDGDNATCLVVAEARLPDGQSAYGKTVVGQAALPEKEPAVFSAFRSGMPVRDILGITQENKSVWQSVVPIKNADGKVIAALIQEKDISERISRDRKYEQLTKLYEQQKEQLHRLGEQGAALSALPEEKLDNRLAMREIHHRVKNNLQRVASMLGLQARNTTLPDVRRTFEENISRILSMASVYEKLALDESGVSVPLLPTLRQIGNTIIHCFRGGVCEVSLRVEGENLPIDSEKAAYISLVVNELAMNAIKHAFPGRRTGEITVFVKRGNEFSTITVADNGTGFPEQLERRETLGTTLTHTIVKQKLGGTMERESWDGGSSVTFSFKNLSP